MTIFPYPSTEIFYPDEDGLPVAESDFQREYLLDSVKILEIYFQTQADVYVSGNLFIYYEQGNPASVVAPDVFVIKGVEKRQRRSYKMWEEGGKAPDFVMEVTSMSTRTQDQGSKKGIYAFLGVQEYFQYDPTGDYLDPQIRGSSLENGNYFTIPQTVLSDGTIVMNSTVLGLELRVLPDGKLRFYNPQTEEYLLTHQETEQARLSAEQARLSAEQARLSAEQKAQRLAEKLRELGIDPESL